MQKLKTFLTVVGAAAVLVLAANTVAFAATGGKFILGRTNKANTISTLKRTTNGPVLTLTTNSSTSAPLSVNGTGKVANLNADRVDGLDGASLQNRVIRYTLPTSSGSGTYQWHFAGLPAGSYLATYSIHSTATAAVSGKCWFLGPSTGATKVLSETSAVGGTLTWDGSGVFRTTEVSDLTCTANTTFAVDITSDGPTEVTFTRIDALSNGTAVPVAP